MGRIVPANASIGSVVGFPSAVIAQSLGIGSPFCSARYILPRATTLLEMSITLMPWPGAGTAIDQGLLPIAFARPPHGAMAGLEFVVSNPIHPSGGAILVK